MNREAGIDLDRFLESGKYDQSILNEMLKKLLKIKLEKKNRDV